MKVIKRDGRAVEYNSAKIELAIEKANREVNIEQQASKDEINKITEYIESLNKKRILVEDIQDIIEEKLMELGKYPLAKKYIVYRYNRTLVRKQGTTDETILGLIRNANIPKDIRTSTVLLPVQRNLIAGEVSKDLTKRILLPQKIVKAVKDGIIYFHNTEFFLQPMINTSLINIGDMLENGTVINGRKVCKPNSFIKACTIISQIIANVVSCQYGKAYVNLKYLGEYFRKSYNKAFSDIKNVKGEENVKEYFSKILEDELSSGIDIIISQITMLTTIYGVVPRIGIILELDSEDEYCAENIKIYMEILKQLYSISENSKEIISNIEMICDFKVKPENNLEINELIQLISKFDSANIKKEKDKQYNYEGHFNYGIVSVNLMQIAHNVACEEQEFWNMLDERLDICYEALMCKHYAMLGTLSDTSPIHWQYGAIARLKTGDKIDKLLKDGYSDLIFGYIGIEKTVEILSTKILNFNEQKFKNKLEKILEEKAQKWRKMTGILFKVECINDEKIEQELIKKSS